MVRQMKPLRRSKIGDLKISPRKLESREVRIRDTGPYNCFFGKVRCLRCQLRLYTELNASLLQVTLWTCTKRLSDTICKDSTQAEGKAPSR